jgi:hypothetical protein
VHRPSKRPTALIGAAAIAIVVVAGVLSLLATGSSTPKSTSFGARTGTVADVHGNSSVAGRPANCLATAAPFPAAPDSFWLSISPTVRVVAPITGYRAWGNPTPPAGCPHDMQTVVYRGFYEFDVTSMLGKSGSISKAILHIKTRGTFVLPATTTSGAPGANFCDNATGGAKALTRVPPATQFNNNGMAINFVNSGPPIDPNVPPIPNAYPGSTVIFNFPGKAPSFTGSPAQPHDFDVDFTPAMVATLQAFEALNTTPPAAAGFARVIFMMTGTNEPPALMEWPLPHSECQGAYSIDLEIQE